jgi:hypothetical protein
MKAAMTAMLLLGIALIFGLITAGVMHGGGVSALLLVFSAILLLVG